jgi:hypothetical protein
MNIYKPKTEEERMHARFNEYCRYSCRFRPRDRAIPDFYKSIKDFCEKYQKHFREVHKEGTCFLEFVEAYNLKKTFSVLLFDYGLFSHYLNYPKKKVEVKKYKSFLKTPKQSFKTICRYCKNIFFTPNPQEAYCGSNCKKTHRKELRLEEQLKISLSEPNKYQERQKIKKGSCCTILKSHAEILKDDPERLSTDFIKKLSNCDCIKKDFQ